MARKRRRGQQPLPKEENGQWKIRYWADLEQDGRMVRKHKTKCLGPVGQVTLSAARRAAREFIAPINHIVTGIEHSKKTVTELIAKWRAAVKPTLKYSTQLGYEWAFKRIQGAFGGRTMTSVDRSEVQMFLTAASGGLAPESLRDLRARLRGLWTLAEDWGWTVQGSNPARGRLHMGQPGPRQRRSTLRPADFGLLVANLGLPYSTVVTLAGLTGLRRGELAALRWEDNPVPGRLIVDEAVYRGRLDTPKTPQSSREVALGPVAQQAIDAWRGQAPFRGPRDFMFAVRSNAPINLINAAVRHLKPAVARLRLPPVTWHSLRHAYTTWGRLAGLRPESLRDQLGHSSVRITLDVYSHIEERASDAVRLEESLGFGAGANCHPILSPQQRKIAVSD